MKASRFSDARKAFILRQAEEGVPIGDVCREAGISQATFHSRRKKHAGMTPPAMRRLKALEDENARLRKLVAGLSLGREMPQDVVRRKLVCQCLSDHWRSIGSPRPAAAVRVDRGVSRRRACATPDVNRPTCRHRSRQPGQAPLEARIKEIRETRVRCGHRRVHVHLRREGWGVNHMAQSKDRSEVTLRRQNLKEEKMTLYAGLDVSMRETAICVADAAGAVVWEGRVQTSVEAIADALAKKAAGLDRAGMETGPVAVWLWHGLRAAGAPVDCIHARRAAAALKLQTNKTDRNDARGLAQLVRSGWYEPVAAKSMATCRARAILGARGQLVGMCTALINKIRGLAKTFGAIVGPGKGGSFDHAMRRATPDDPLARELFEALLATLASLRARRAAFDRQLAAIARASASCRLLMTAPGVGPLTALAFAGTVEDPGRFRRSSDVGAYLGLTPRRHQSGEVDQAGRISKCGDRLTRRLLFEAASVVLYRTRTALGVRVRAERIAARSGSRKARVALARKLATILFVMMRDRTPFEARAAA